MSISRRDFLAATGAAAVAGGLGPLAAFGQNKPIMLGSVLDNSGNLDIYGKPMVMATTMAVEEINAAGGLLGRKIKVIQYDTQSDIALYTKFAQQLARDRQGGCRARRHHLGLARGDSPDLQARQHAVLLQRAVRRRRVRPQLRRSPAPRRRRRSSRSSSYATKKWGKKVYILAADYNYGQITAKWLQHYIAQRGGSVASTDFFPLDVADFGSTIAKIQQAKPDWVVSALVGGAHMSFYRQWAAQGMNKKIPLASTTFGVGNEHLALSPAEGDGIIIAGNYSQEANTPANKEFLARWQKRFGDTKIVHEIAVSQYQGIYVWAECVKKAGSLDRNAHAEGDRVRALHRRAGRHGHHRAEDPSRCAGHPPDGGEEPEAHHPQHRQAAPAFGHPAVLRPAEESEREQAVRGEHLAGSLTLET